MARSEGRNQGPSPRPPRPLAGEPAEDPQTVEEPENRPPCALCRRCADGWLIRSARSGLHTVGTSPLRFAGRGLSPSRGTIRHRRAATLPILLAALAYVDIWRNQG